MNMTDQIIAGKPADEKLPPQAREIVKAVRATHGVTLDRLATKLDGKLKTKQPVKRIISFYMPRLKKGGYLKVAHAKKQEPRSKKIHASAKAA